MNIGIFGGTGFIGAYITGTCAAAGHNPVLLVRSGRREKVSDSDRCAVVEGELGDPGAIRTVLADAEAAVYAVGLIREFPRRGITFEELHVNAFRKVLDIAEETGVRRLILISANGVKPDGNAYPRTKYRAEEKLRSSTVEGIVLRPSIVFGDPGGKFEFTTMVRDSIITPPLPVPLFFYGLDLRNAGKFRLAPVHVTDVAQAVLRTLEHPEPETIYHLCGPDEFTWRELTVLIARVTGSKKSMLPVPTGAIRFVGALFDRFGWFPVTRDQIDMLLEGNVCEQDSGFKRLGIEPVPFNALTLSYLLKKTQ